MASIRLVQAAERRSRSLFQASSSARKIALPCGCLFSNYASTSLSWMNMCASVNLVLHWYFSAWNYIFSTQKIYFPSQQQPADVFFPMDLEAHCIGVFVFNLQSEGRSIEISAIIWSYISVDHVPGSFLLNCMYCKRACVDGTSSRKCSTICGDVNIPIQSLIWNVSCPTTSMVLSLMLSRMNAHLCIIFTQVRTSLIITNS